MAISSIGVFLMVKKSEETSYSKLVDIVDFPDIGGDPELLDTTTLSDKIATSILGIQQQESLPFTMNYTWTEVQTLKASEYKEMDFSIWFGGDDAGDGTITPTGADGKWNFKGMYTLKVNGTGTNDVVKCTLTIAASTAPYPATT